MLACRFTGPPGAPTVTQVSATLTSVTISWTEATSNPMYPVLGYDLLFNGTVTMVGLVTMYKIPGLMSGMTYTVEVRARNAAGDGELGTVMASTLSPMGELHTIGTCHAHICTFIHSMYRSAHAHTYTHVDAYTDMCTHA